MYTGSKAEQLKNAAAQNPGKATALSLLTTPLAMKAGGIALRWARRNPGLALVVGAGALAWWGAKRMRGMRAQGDVSGMDASSAGMGTGTGTNAGAAGRDQGTFDFPGAAHGEVGGYGATRASRSAGGDTSSASSL